MKANTSVNDILVNPVFGQGLGEYDYVLVCLKYDVVRNVKLVFMGSILVVRSWGFYVEVLLILFLYLNFI